MDLLDALREHRLLAIVRGDDPEGALRAVEVLLRSGIALLEVSLTTSGAQDVIRRAVKETGPRTYVGAGTVLDADDADRAVEAGATFLVTPGIGPGVARGVDLGVPVLAGAFTASEAMTAMAQGSTAVKLFPAAVGGPAYLRALREPLPHVPFVPVGGIRAEDVGPYLDAGAVAVGVGSPLLGDAVNGGDLAALRDRAEQFTRAVATTTGEPDR